MGFGAILLLAVGLAMDATAAAATRGLAATGVRPRDIALVAVLFGGFQGLMPLLGFFVGQWIGPRLEAWDHWIAFVLLGGIGGKMLWEARPAKDDTQLTEGADKSAPADPFGARVMVVLAIATSIDALAVGVTLPMLKAPFALSLVTIGVTTALLSALGVVAGRRFGSALGKRLDVFGGLVLIGLGVKILVEHLRA